MSFIRRAFNLSYRDSKSSTIFSKFKNINNNSNNINFNNFKSQFKRSYHFNSTFKRPNLSKSKWNAFDELKLFSYTSHLAFFMLLPPIIQMYTTKVEVTRDDTIDESPFTCVNSNNGLIIRNINFLDIIQTEKNKLINLYSNNTNSYDKSDNKLTNDIINNSINNQDSNSNSNNHSNNNNDIKINDLDCKLKLIDDNYNLLNNKLITNNQYISRMENLTDEIISINYRMKFSKNEIINNSIMKIFDQLHKLRLYKVELNLFKRLLTSFKDSNNKILNIKYKIIQNYELKKNINLINKKHKGNKKYKRIIKHKNENINSDILPPVKELMEVSIWLKSYVENFERFAQLVQMFAINNQSKNEFYSLFKIGFKSKDVCEKLQNPEQRYGLISILKGFNKEKEALMLSNKMKRLTTSN